MNPVTQQDIQGEGYSHNYAPKTSKHFKDALNNTHNITLDNIIQGIAVIIIQSDPITIYLLPNQTYKLNLTSEEYYDIQITVREVNQYLANITLKAINESIPEPIVYHITEDEQEDISKTSAHNISLIIFLFLILIMLIVALIITKRLKRKNPLTNHGKK